ncbi:hypothetical protein SISNIDRAFT_491323 [Sistotremastrum niveocremeum HHB9708]|uniref:Uncharacterized protein n=2 Tax=Sistotremastraceae TaxID=3402574 RepID=A0A164MW64_9AGAM|nr:hypothetical protein SISNIDRAFT_491323 [Sistotremastrum niveocremeum HHB9708]KZT31751.1 hypothetical protein SISSUDRAFT_1067494 [Sistotremastrum suecicum HHB10207 ss-3]
MGDGPPRNSGDILILGYSPWGSLDPSPTSPAISTRPRPQLPLSPPISTPTISQASSTSFSNLTKHPGPILLFDPVGDYSDITLPVHWRSTSRRGITTESRIASQPGESIIFSFYHRNAHDPPFPHPTTVSLHYPSITDVIPHLFDFISDVSFPSTVYYLILVYLVQDPLNSVLCRIVLSPPVPPVSIPPSKSLPQTSKSIGSPPTTRPRSRSVRRLIPVYMETTGSVVV